MLEVHDSDIVGLVGGIKVNNVVRQVRFLGACADDTDSESEVHVLECMLVKSGIRCDHPRIREYLRHHYELSGSGHASAENMLEWLVEELFAEDKWKVTIDNVAGLTDALRELNILEADALNGIIGAATSESVHDDLQAIICHWVLSVGGPSQATFPCGHGSGRARFELCGTDTRIMWAYHADHEPGKLGWRAFGEDVLTQLEGVGLPDAKTPEKYWFHGTSHENAASIARTGPRMSACGDCGAGFYLGSTITSALHRADLRHFGQPAAVLLFRATRVNPDDDAQYSFRAVSDEWKRFVFANIHRTPLEEMWLWDTYPTTRYARIISPISADGRAVRQARDVRADPGINQCVLRTPTECMAWQAELAAVVFLGVREPLDVDSHVAFPVLASVR